MAERVDAAGNIQVPLVDGLGSVRAVTDGAGNVAQSAPADYGVPSPCQQWPDAGDEEIQ